MSEHASNAAVTDVLARFPRERTWLLPALQAVQDVVGYLPDWALADTGRHLRVPDSEVYGVATHYPELRRLPRGKHHVRVCTGVSCALSGGRALLDAIALRDEVRAGETGADRELTLVEADCFFECSVAPLVEVDGAYRGRVTLDDIGRLDRWFVAPSAHPAHGAPVLVSASPRGESVSAERCLESLVAEATARQRARPPLSLHVQTGTCGRAVGGEPVLAALRLAVPACGLEARVIDGACNGMCYAAPTVLIQREGWPLVLIERLDEAAIPALLDRLATVDASFAAAGLTGIVWAERPWRGL